jgi:hypothetical protein
MPADARLTPTRSRLVTAFLPLSQMGRLPQAWPVVVSVCLPCEQVANRGSDLLRLLLGQEVSAREHVGPPDTGPRPLTLPPRTSDETEAGTPFGVVSQSPGGRLGAVAQPPRPPDQRGSVRCRRRSWPRPRQAHCRPRAAPRSQPTCRSRPAGAPRRHSTAPPKRRRPHPGVKLRRQGRARSRAPRHHGRPLCPIPRAPVRIDPPAPATSDDQRPTPARRRTPMASGVQRYGPFGSLSDTGSAATLRRRWCEATVLRAARQV